MGTDIRPELSERNKYYIPRHRYYELKHFCLQYPFWKRQYVLLSGYSRREPQVRVKSTSLSDATANAGIDRAYYSERIALLDRVAKQTDDMIGRYILKAVTEGLSYETVKLRLDIPCCRETYYELYRKFFWLLDSERG